MRVKYLFTFAFTVFVLILSVNLSSLAPLAQTNSPQNQTPRLANDDQEMKRLFDEGEKAYNQDHFSEAIKAWQDGLEIAQRVKNDRNTTVFLTDIGLVYDTSFQYSTALEYYQKVLAIREKNGDKHDLAEVLNNIGGVYISKGEYDSALPHLQRALKLCEESGAKNLVAAVLNNLGVTYNAMGDYDNALGFLQHTFQIQMQAHDKQGVAETFMNIGMVYSAMGQYDRALECEEPASDFFVYKGNEAIQKKQQITTKMSSDIARSLSNIGNVYYSLEKYKDALRYHELAAILLASSHDGSGLVVNTYNIGNIYFAQQKYDEALWFFNLGFQKATEINDDQDIAYCLSNIGAVYNIKGQYEQALKNFQQALRIYEKLGKTLSNVDIFINIASVYTNLKRLPDAEEYYQRAFKQYETARQGIGEPTDIGRFQETTNNLYIRYADLLCQRKKFTDALITVETMRGRGLAKQTEQGHTKLSSLLSKEDAILLHQIVTALSRASSRLHNLEKRSVPTGAEQKQAFEAALKEAQANYKNMENNWRLFRAGLFAQKKYATYRRLQGADPPTFDQLVRLSRLQSNKETLYLEYAIEDRNSTLLFALHNGELTTFHLSNGKDKLSKLTTLWMQALAHYDENKIKYKQEEKLAATALYSLLFSDLEKTGTLSRSKHLVIVPDGPLLNIPFAALMDQQGKRLLEKHALSTSLSLGMLTWPPNARASSKTLLCAADPMGAGGANIQSLSRGRFAPLRFARKETEELINQFSPKRFPDDVKGLFGPLARKNTFKQIAGEYKVLHLATHSVANGTNGMRSFLVLTPDGDEDGFLEAREIAELSLSAKLATLSACETAQGQKSGGEGLLGLAWAFQAAGVPAIVASQWEVDDEANCNLMSRFYKNLLQGKRKDDALREAMIDTSKEDFHHPACFWAAFEVIGDTSPVWPKSTGQTVAKPMTSAPKFGLSKKKK